MSLLLTKQIHTYGSAGGALASLVLLTVLSGSTALAAATPPDATETITPATNASTAAQPYATISTTDSFAINNEQGVAQSVYMGGGGAYQVSGGRLQAVSTAVTLPAGGVTASGQGSANSVTGLETITANGSYPIGVRAGYYGTNAVVLTGPIQLTYGDCGVGVNAQSHGSNTITGLTDLNIAYDGKAGGSNPLSFGFFANDYGSNTVTMQGSLSLTAGSQAEGLTALAHGSNMVKGMQDLNVTGTTAAWGMSARSGGANTLELSGSLNVAATNVAMGLSAIGGTNTLNMEGGRLTVTSTAAGSPAYGMRAAEQGALNKVTGLGSISVENTSASGYAYGIMADDSGTNDVALQGPVTVKAARMVIGIGSDPGPGTAPQTQATIKVTGLTDVTAVSTDGDSKAIAARNGSLVDVTMSGKVSATSASAEALYADAGAHLTVKGPQAITAVGTGTKLDAAAVFGTGHATINLQMDGTISTRSNGVAYGVGAFDGSQITVDGNVQVTAASNWNAIGAFPLYADAGTVNVGTDGTSSLQRTVQVPGNVQAVNGGVINLTLDQSGSYLQGNVYEDTTGVVKLALANGGTWRPLYGEDTYNSLKSLNLQAGGLVDLTWDNALRTQPRTMEVTQLAGSGGSFRLNTNLAAGTGDTISIGADSTATQSVIKVGYDPSWAADGQALGGYKVVTAAPLGLNFISVPTEYGPRQYLPNLAQNTDGSWNINGLTASPSRNVITAGGVRETVQGSWFQHANSLSKRLGDLRLDASRASGTSSKGDDEAVNGIWARYQRGTTRAGRGPASELNANLLQVGYDKAFARKDGRSYWGLAVDHLNGSTEYANGSGKAKSTTVALYNTWIGDSGHYYDVILRQGHFASEYGVVDTEGVYNHGDYGVNGTTLSGEYGYRKQLGGGSYLEPQAELIVGRLGSADYLTTTGWPVHVDGMKHFITRLGVAAGRTGRQGSFYGRCSYFHDFGGAGSISYADYGYERTALRDWLELTVGGDVLLGRSVRFYGEVTKYLGDVTNNFNFSAGLRWNF